MPRRSASALPGGRRTWLFLCVAVFATTAGCAGLFAEDSGGADDPAPIDLVPEGTTVLVHLEASTIEDGDAERLLEGLEGVESDRADLETRRGTLENRTGLDPFAAEDVLAFETGTSTGYLLEADRSGEDVVSSIEDAEGLEYERTEYEGEAVLYEPPGDGFYVGDLGGGQFVVGDETAVRGSLEVRYGDADPLTGPVRDAYDEAGDGQLVVVTEPEGSLVPDDEAFDSPLIDLEVFEEIRAVSRAYTVTDDGLAVEAGLLVPDEETAVDLEETTEAVFAVLGSTEEFEDLDDALADVEIERDGRIVRLTYDGEVDAVSDVLEGI